MATLIRNTDKNLPCTNCGGPGNIIREGDDPRLKCNNCGFMYNQSESEAALKVDAIPDGPPDIPVDLPKVELPPPVLPNPQHSTSEGPLRTRVPRNPAYVFVSKDRTITEFTTKKDIKKVTLLWETSGKRYDCFELTPKSVTATVDIQ